MSDLSIFETVYLTISSFNMQLNFFFHIVIFSGAFIVAFKNERLPHWHVTPLWWIGLTSLLCATTIVLQYIFGPAFTLAYKNVGIFLELLLNGCLALLAGTFLFAHFFRKKSQQKPPQKAPSNRKRKTVRSSKRS